MPKKSSRIIRQSPNTQDDIRRAELDIARRARAAFDALSIEEAQKYLSRLSLQQAQTLRYNWQFNARASQIIPFGPWTYWVVLAGRGFGKTRTGAEAVRYWARHHNNVNIAGPTQGDVRDIMVEGESGILAVCPPNERPRYNSSQAKLIWPNGGKSLLLSAEEPDRFRGKQHEKLWADELASWRNTDAWDQMVLGLRLGHRPQAVVTTTPRPTKLIRSLVENPNAIVTRGTSYDNRANLASAFYDAVVRMYENTRLGRQELNGEILTDNPNALFSPLDIDAGRITHDTFMAKRDSMVKIVVAIDPAASSNENSDETGIVAVATDGNDYYVLEDWSGIYTPRQWAERAIALAEYVGADVIVGEGNNGGEMVEYTLQTVNRDFPVRLVRASRGKAIRAEPASAAYEQHRVHHVGSLPKLEDQMTLWNPSGSDGSPDRLDALVWALTECGLGYFDTTGIIRYTQQLAAESKTPQRSAAENAIEAMRMQANGR